jgi:UDP-N-acetylmuramate--alanine ligase
MKDVARHQTVHFVGIGGIGMSGIAEVLVNLGYRVQGSDIAENANVQRLRQKGVTVAIGHDAANLGEATVVVVSSAIKRDNPELKAARERLLAVVRRAEMLAELMRLKEAVAVAGTTARRRPRRWSALLVAGGFDPTVINGGIIKPTAPMRAWGERLDGGRGGRIRRHLRQAAGRRGAGPNIDPEHLD